jgi:acetate kinase
MTSAPAGTADATAGEDGRSWVLVLNSGSSSVKFAVVEAATGERALSGIAERLGTPEAVMRRRDGEGGDNESQLDGDDHAAAVDAILSAVRQLDVRRKPTAVGHRVVHGGDRFSDSVLIDDDVVAAIDEYAPLAPLHNPGALLGIDAARAAMPELPQVAVFDTSFHQTMPPSAYRYAVPDEWFADYRVRRYGFHGTSDRYVSGKAAELLARPPAELALVVAHLGNGCSATAVLEGRSVDTTMGLTPLEGLVMGTRSGDVDPAIFGYLAGRAGLSVSEVTDALNTRSGLLGLSRLTNDMREIGKAADEGDERARLAIDVFVHRLTKALAGLVVPLGRLDALVFTGGIGENSASVRARAVGALGFLGLTLDDEANRSHGRGTDGRISGPSGPAVLVVPTDEELMIALDTVRLAGGDGR